MRIPNQSKLQILGGCFSTLLIYTGPILIGIGTESWLVGVGSMFVVFGYSQSFSAWQDMVIEMLTDEDD